MRERFKKRYLIAAIVILGGLMVLWKTLNAPEPKYQTLIVRPESYSKVCWPPESWMHYVKSMLVR